MQSLIMTQPDDWHSHLRDDIYLNTTVLASARYFARTIVMPNLADPVTTAAKAAAYRQRILNACPKDSSFEPLMTLYLTDETTVDIVKEANLYPFIKACKLYPAFATTHSNYGVTNIEKLYPIFAIMEVLQLPLLIHGEVTDPSVDIFDREARFIEQHLIPLQQRFSALPIVLEHITTSQAVDYVISTSENVAATITAHHLLYHRNAIFQGGIQPDLYCLPILKRQTHQQALIKAAISGNKKFFLGTDSAPHAQSKKYCASGCAGIFSAHAALELYASVFEAHHSLNKLEGFASFYGADFYRLPRNKNQILLEKNAWEVPKTLSFGEETLTPLMAGEIINWKVTIC